MRKSEAGGIDSRFAALLFAFVVGAFFDWYFNHPSDTYWLGVGAAFILLAVYLSVSNTETRVKPALGFNAGLPMPITWAAHSQKTSCWVGPPK